MSAARSPWVQLRPLTRSDLPIVEPWFDDDETSRYLGGRDWPGRMLELAALVIGTEFRGAIQTGAYRFLANRDGCPVGLIDCGVFDRWTEYSGEDVSEPIVREEIHLPTGTVTYVINPELRGQGLGRLMIRALVVWPELSEVRLFEAGVEPETLPQSSVCWPRAFDVTEAGRTTKECCISRCCADLVPAYSGVSAE